LISENNSSFAIEKMSQISTEARAKQNARLILEFLFRFYIDEEFKKQILEEFKKKLLEEFEKSVVTELEKELKMQQFISIKRRGDVWEISGKFLMITEPNNITSKDLMEGLNYGLFYDFIGEKFRQKIRFSDRDGSAKDKGAAKRSLTAGFRWLCGTFDKRKSNKDKKDDKPKYAGINILEDVTKERVGSKGKGDTTTRQTRFFEGLKDVDLDRLSIDDIDKKLDDIFRDEQISAPDRERHRNSIDEENNLDPVPQTNKVYLTLRIEKNDSGKHSDSGKRKQKEYIISAWFDRGNEPIHLKTNIKVAISQLPKTLGELIKQCHKKMSAGQQLDIEIYSEINLINEPFPNWKYDCSTIEQLRESYFVYVRWLERWSIVEEYNYQEKWQTKWSAINNQSLCEQSEDPDWDRHIRNSLWFNACRTDVKKHLQKLTVHGIPMILWSRCSHRDHWDDINQLVRDKTGQQLLEEIQCLRCNAPTKIEPNSTELGHHLSLIWEDPHRPPPWSWEEEEREKASLCS